MGPGLSVKATSHAADKADFVCLLLVLPLYCYQPISLHPRAHTLSHVIPWTAAHQAPLSMDFSRQEYWSGLPFPSPVCLFLTYKRIFNYISFLSTDKLVNAVYIGHFHWLAGGSSTKGSHGFHWIIFLARLSSFSA